MTSRDARAGDLAPRGDALVEQPDAACLFDLVNTRDQLHKPVS